MNKKELLTIGYSTLVDTFDKITFLESVQNLVIVQNPKAIKLPQIDKNIRVVELQSRGVAKSRNTAIDQTTTEYLLFGDDDIEFREESINLAIEYLESNKEISILLLQTVDEEGKLRKQYSRQACPLNLTNSAKAATYEIVIRVKDIKKSAIRFDENFGAGTENYLGDEYIFIADAICIGLKGFFLPIVIATHSSESSGSFHNTRQDAIVRSRIFSRVFGMWAPVMRFLFILKPPSKKFGLGNSITFLIGR